MKTTRKTASVPFPRQLPANSGGKLAADWLALPNWFKEQVRKNLAEEMARPDADKPA